MGCKIYLFSVRFNCPLGLTYLQGMEELIKQAFLHVEAIGPHVQEGHYDLIGPTGEIILPQVWEALVEPGWSVSMHMWPMPEPGPGPKPGHNFPPRGRPGNRGHHMSSHGPRPPPQPSNWPGGPPRGVPPPPAPGWAPEGSGVGGPPIIVNTPSRTGTRRKDAGKGVLGWMAAKPTAKSGKGRRIDGERSQPKMEPGSPRLRGGGGRRASLMDSMSGAGPESSKKGTFVTGILKSIAS